MEILLIQIHFFSGDYILRIIDSTLCERVDTFTIVGPNVLVVNSNVIDVSCGGVMMDLLI